MQPKCINRNCLNTFRLSVAHPYAWKQGETTSSKTVQQDCCVGRAAMCSAACARIGCWDCARRQITRYAGAVLTDRVVPIEYSEDAYTRTILIVVNKSVRSLSGKRSLRSTSNNSLLVPPAKRSTVGSRDFPVAGQKI